ncbi:MAG: PorV/PorQ family protein [Calditrichaeota bacterium]|nr:MAG: PorV/PorQ family protein [Calditrichota bacterium]
MKMKISKINQIKCTVGCILLLLTMALPAAAQDYDKIAQTGFQFLSVSSDAKASALANAATALPLRAGSLFFNPAGMAEMKNRFDLAFSMNQWIADIRYNTFSAAVSPAKGRYGVFGVSVQSVDYGEIIGTRVAPNLDEGYIETGNFNPDAGCFGLGYARQLSDHFLVGGQIKWARQRLGENLLPTADGDSLTVKNELTPMAFDFGTLYKTGFKSLQFGMSVRNFSKEVKYAQDSFQLPLAFALGIAMDMLDWFADEHEMHSLLFSIDAVHDRSHREQLLMGMDYTFLNTLSLRLGYTLGNDEDNVTLGFGFTSFGIVLDYAYTPFGVFDSVQRVSARFSL